MICIKLILIIKVLINNNNNIHIKLISIIKVIINNNNIYIVPPY
jgi:hypothetical protein